eukprot:scaffold37178_cov60-Phaeocystis_antarctica.AAC.1
MGWTTTRDALKGKSKIPVSKRDETGFTGIYFSANRQISGDRELVSFCKEFSPQIPNAHFKFRRADPKTCPPQNSEDCRFPVSRNKVRSRGHRFLGTYFPILVSEFKFPPRSRIWDASHFSFLDSRCKSKDAHGLEIAQFQFLISQFTILVSKRPLHIPNPPVPHFSFLVSGFKGSPPFMGSEASTFIDSDFSILVAQIAEN